MAQNRSDQEILDLLLNPDAALFYLDDQLTNLDDRIADLQEQRARIVSAIDTLRGRQGIGDSRSNDDRGTLGEPSRSVSSPSTTATAIEKKADRVIVPNPEEDTPVKRHSDKPNIIIRPSSTPLPTKATQSASPVILSGPSKTPAERSSGDDIAKRESSVKNPSAMQAKSSPRNSATAVNIDEIPF